MFKNTVAIKLNWTEKYKIIICKCNEVAYCKKINNYPDKYRIIICKSMLLNLIRQSREMQTNGKLATIQRNTKISKYLEKYCKQALNKS